VAPDEIPEDPINPAFAERPATKFDDPENPPEELPNGNAPADEPLNVEGDYDPADHTVDEVLAYAAEHPDEVDAILEAELVGKNRSGIMDKL
jgi:hypothetical protein